VQIFTILLRSKYNVLVATLLVLASVVILPIMPNLRLVLRVNFEITVALTLAAFLWRINKWMSLFLVLSTASMMYPFYDAQSYFAFQAVFYATVWYAVIVKTIDNVDSLLNAICIIALFNIAFMFLQLLDIDPLFKPIHGAKGFPVGLSGNINSVSALLAFCFPAFMRRKWVYFTPLIVTGLIVTKSMGGMLALACGLIFYFWMYGFRFMPVATLLVGLILYGSFVDTNILSSFNIRLTVIWETLGYYTQHWVMGSGIGHFKIQIGKTFLYPINNLYWMTVHNEFVQGLFEMGVAFPFIIGGYYVGIYKRFMDGFMVCGVISPGSQAAILPITALIVISTNSMVHFPFHIAPTAMIAVTWMAILDIKLRPEKVL
jgi:hypothetical protein